MLRFERLLGVVILSIVLILIGCVLCFLYLKTHYFILFLHLIFSAYSVNMLFKLIPESVEENAYWKDSDIIVFTEEMEYKNEMTFIKKLEVDKENISKIVLILENNTWTLVVTTVKSKNYLQNITLNEDFIRKLIEYNFFSLREYEIQINKKIPLLFNVLPLDFLFRKVLYKENK